MQPFIRHSGIVATLDRVHVDTDQIIPKQFLKRVERSGFGQYLFYDWKYLQDGSLNPEFELNQLRFNTSSILATRSNFGCGSSREHAPWALEDYGFKVILAPSFADIFLNNCFKNGLLAIALPEDEIERIFTKAEQAGYSLSVDLENQMIQDDQGLQVSFQVDPYRRTLLLQGLDDIGVTFQHVDKIDEYEKKLQAIYQKC